MRLAQENDSIRAHTGRRRYRPIVDYGYIDLDEPRNQPTFPDQPANPDLVVTHRSSGFTGTVSALGESEVILRDPAGRKRRFTRAAGAFAVNGKPVRLVNPTNRPQPAATTTVSASGALIDRSESARVAQASRIWVEGIHDAELIEKVWGTELAGLGIVVEPKDGIDDLVGEIANFGPAPERRLGVLVDHLVDGSKEQRIVRQVDHPQVLVRGHPFIDVWESIRPVAVGIDSWPRVPMGEDWKNGVCTRLGWTEHTSVVWKRILGTVTGFAQLEQPLITAVEELIDFVAPPISD